MNTTKLFFSGIEKKDLEVFELLYEMHYSRLCCISYQIVSNDEDAENIVTSVFLDLWEERSSCEILPGIKSSLCKAVFQKSVKLLNSRIPENKSIFEFDFSRQESSESIPELKLKLI